MTDKQPKALRLADEFEATKSYLGAKAAAELRRLHEEVQQWQDKCNTYMELHDAVVKDNERLHEVNAELVEALHMLVVAVDKHGLSTEFQRFLSKADYALAKAQGDNND